MVKMILIGCGKSKQSCTVEAQDLYTGSIFKARRAYAEASGSRWMIVSAKHGLMGAMKYISPYDLTMKDLDRYQRLAWAEDIAEVLRCLCVSEVELHMGRDYAEPLISALETVGIVCSWPVKGLSQGYQLQWYKQQKETVR